MSVADATFAGSIPENYHRHLGPFLFEPYARDLAARLRVRDDARVLELACGTGIATRLLRERLPRTARLVATDLNEPMLEQARRFALPDDGIEWRQADAAALPFGDGGFDAVVCQFGLMFVPDKAAAFREARRVLAPGGTLLFNVWDSLERNEISRLAHRTIGGFYPDDPPRFYETPFGFHQEDLIRSLLAAGGFTETRLETVTIEGVCPSARDLAAGMVLGTPVSIAIRERGTVPPDTIVAAVAQAVAGRFGDAPVRAPLRALVVETRAGAR